ncbi:RdgB/HAM1 family non-canonical purine NTP pyrophosphatase [Sorangium sp. So ce1099]|uniref:RdgB/HAM1 family non-canonical purine NTP pyrophosphatase n=1 Tax=Sorangium sp. So ce1099 TaxID=3133331 RepID=UPI003F6350CF
MSREPLRLLAATSNRGKLAELRSLLADLPIEVRSLAEVLPDAPPVVEDGETFLDNALLKVRAGALRSSLVTLAEDSGLEVDALGGRPGVRSARFAREGATDAENNEALLSALARVPDDQRRARFRCVMVLLDPRSEAPPIVTEGRCEGWIGRHPRGAGGFGYDPLFVVEDYGRTMAELGEAEKNLVSHRGKAAQAMRASLEALIARRA